jgi:hypothetical protein
MTAKKRYKFGRVPPLSEKRARLIKEMHKAGKCVRHIAGACSVIFGEEVPDSRVRAWLQQLGLEPVVMSDKERLELAGKGRANKGQLRPDMKKIQPVDYRVQNTPYEKALEELILAGMPTSGTPIEIMRRANAIRKQQGKPQFDKCPEWIC